MDYLAQLYWQPDAEVRTWVDTIGTKSFRLYEEIWQEDRICVKAKVTYVMLSPTSIIFTHTLVPVSLKGQGIASYLAKYVLDYARENNLNVIPQCPFIRSYIERHPEYDDLVMKSTR